LGADLDNVADLVVIGDLTVRLHMGVIFDPSVRYSTISPVLVDTVLSALMTL